MKKTSAPYLHRIVWPALTVTAADQFSKLAILRSIRLHESVPVIPGFFDLVHVRNRGMAFGFLNRPDMDPAFYFLVAVGLAALALLLTWCIRLKDRDPRLTLGLSLIMGGAVGNLIDRFRYGEVIDFLDVYVGRYHWPAFNVADSAITVGTLWVALSLTILSPERRR